MEYITGSCTDSRYVCARYYKYWYKCTGITLNSMLLANMKKFLEYQYTEMLIDTIQH